jgi:hypothetical protein
MGQFIQNRSDLYDRTALTPPSGVLRSVRSVSQVCPPEGVYEAELIDVAAFRNAFQDRIALTFRIVAGGHAGAEIIDAAAATDSPRGKLASILSGLGAPGYSLEVARRMIGTRCRIVVAHETNRAGMRYAGIAHVFR